MPSDITKRDFPIDESFDAREGYDIRTRDEVAALLREVKSYHPSYDEELLLRGVDFCIASHGAQKRKSGEPYFFHPVAVARHLANMRMDQRTIITALLHDVVEDTHITLEDIEREFDAKTAQLVDGVTKLTKIRFRTDNERQAENFRKLLLAISEDIRVLLVKLADRLHNMQTLHHIRKPEKRRRIAHETMEIYAPLAERIGMQNIKDALQDVAFKELHPDGYRSVINRLEYLRALDHDIVNKVVNEMSQVLEDAGVKAQVSGREKTPYSIWRKMQKKNIGFEQLCDIMAFRIVTDSCEDCYRALGVVHGAYHMIPEFFKDFISTPKNNGYQSIHTVVMGPAQRIEVQIRTRDMHDIAEMGVAAHWSYKQDQSYNPGSSKQYQWIRELLYIIEHTQEPDELLEHTRLEMYHDQVFCFTPKGDLIALPRGATPVDFAFAVHSGVGRSCVGAKVNGRIVPLRTCLNNGDQVEVIQSRSQNPSSSWENFVVTGKARSEVRRHIRLKRRKEYISLGRDMLQKALIGKEELMQDINMKQLAHMFHKPGADDLYAALGEGSITRRQVMELLMPEEDVATSQDSTMEEDTAEKEALRIPINGLIPGMAIHFADCCRPLPGDMIVGIVNSGKGVDIHRADCDRLEEYADQPQRWVDVSWDDSAEKRLFIGCLHATLYHEKGSLGVLANIVAQNGGNINNLSITNRLDDFFEMHIDIEVFDREHMETIISELRARPAIYSVKRCGGEG